MPEAVFCRDVHRTYRSPAGAVEALRGADASFSPGALGALVGPSGCGKSTLLRVLAGLDPADDGIVEVDGVDVTTLQGRSLRRFRREVVTYVAQRAASNLVPHLTIREHLARVADAALLRTLGLGDRLDARAGQLSGGEQARAALGIALARDTPVLLADEPTAELDGESARRVVDALLAAAAAGRTVVVATHDPALVGAATATAELALRHEVLPVAPPARRERGRPVLVARGVTKRYGDAHALEDVSLELAAGELGILLGRSGSGKSTLLMAAGGWLSPDRGELTVAGAPVGPRPPWRQIAFLPQRFGLLPELSVRENVGLPFRLSQTPEDGRVDELLDRLDLVALADRTPPETSVGQQQRVALARALAVAPPLLLADEPTSHQDAGHAEAVWATLLAARANGTACLLATHDPAAAPRGDRVWEIADGRLA